MNNSIPGLFNESSFNAVEAIDYYFARMMSECSLLDAASADIWFHSLLALSVMQREGHTCLELDHIANQRLFYDDEKGIKGYHFPPVEQLVSTAKQALTQGTASAALRLSDSRLYTQRYWVFEQTIADALHQRREMICLSEDQYQRLAGLWPVLFPGPYGTNQDWQQIATAASVVKPFVVINGGPGTGKTYTVTRLLLALQCVSDGALEIQLAAPTGKAAQRLSESIAASLATMPDDQIAAHKVSVHEQAVTLHRLLGLERFAVGAKHHQKAPLRCDALIIDEASMVDVALMARVVRALKPGCRLILLGDANQLPAVESGNVLEAITAGGGNAHLAVSEQMADHISRVCPHLPALEISPRAQDFVYSLQGSQRFKRSLADVADAILQGMPEAAWECIQPVSEQALGTALLKEGVHHCALEPALTYIESLAKVCFGGISHCSDLASAMQAVKGCRWLTPVRKGPVGVEQLNALAQRVLSSAAWSGDDINRFYKGRPIMVMENSYAQSLFNGDVGLIWPDEQGKLKAWFEVADGSFRAISLARLPRIETVYAMTIHKSQGSEFSTVVMFVPAPTNSQLALLCSRELLYTGLTRTKNSCLLLCDKTDFAVAVSRHQQRFSGLGEKLYSTQN